MACPSGPQSAFRVLLYSIAELVVTFRVLCPRLFRARLVNPAGTSWFTVEFGPAWSPVGKQSVVSSQVKEFPEEVAEQVMRPEDGSSVGSTG